MLIKHKADLNSKDNSNWTPLHHAAAHDTAVSMQILLKHKADMNLEDSWGWTPLMVAAKSGNVQGVIILLEYGADIGVLSQDEETFFDIAIDSGQEMVCKAVLDNGR